MPVRSSPRTPGRLCAARAIGARAIGPRAHGARARRAMGTRGTRRAARAGERVDALDQLDHGAPFAAVDRWRSALRERARESLHARVDRLLPAAARDVLFVPPAV